jgi:hypothetical protein
MKPPHAKRSKTKGQKGIQPDNNKEGDLKAHIRALGGNVEDDFELLKGVDSDGPEDIHQSSPANVSELRAFRLLIYLLLQPKIANDVAKFMKSLDFGSARKATTEEETVTVDSNNERLKAKKEDKNAAQGRASNGTAVAKVAEIAGKVVENTKGGRTKFVRVVFAHWRSNLTSRTRLCHPPRSGTLPSLRSLLRSHSLLPLLSSCLPKSLSQRPFSRKMLQHTLSHLHIPPLPPMPGF